ncbi:MAG: hypothetical protein MZW92_46445 [Comamonadaceae bacterium]|nr:hypothetical protein [Comamonadaceae bacterium]
MVEAINQHRARHGHHAPSPSTWRATPMLARLREVGVDYAQGFAIRRPAPLEPAPAGAVSHAG